MGDAKVTVVEWTPFDAKRRETWPEPNKNYPVQRQFGDGDHCFAIYHWAGEPESPEAWRKCGVIAYAPPLSKYAPPEPVKDCYLCGHDTEHHLRRLADGRIACTAVECCLERQLKNVTADRDTLKSRLARLDELVGLCREYKRTVDFPTWPMGAAICKCIDALDAGEAK